MCAQASAPYFALVLCAFAIVDRLFSSLLMIEGTYEY